MSVPIIRPITILTAATPGPYALLAERLRLQADAQGCRFHCHELPAAAADDRRTAWKAAVIAKAIADGRAPFWYIDADDQLTGGPLWVPAGTSVGYVLNPERKIMQTPLGIADCVHFWSGDKTSREFAGVWHGLSRIGPNSHRALLAAILFYFTPDRPGLADVTPCLAGSFLMSARGQRPEARL